MKNNECTIYIATEHGYTQRYHKEKNGWHKPIQTVKFGCLVQNNYYHTSCHLLLGLGLLALGWNQINKLKVLRKSYS